MRFEVRLVHSADGDLDAYTVREQRILLDAISEFLEIDADVPTRRRKQLRSNPLAPWELRIGNFRLFYEITSEKVVRVLAVGHKVHNELYIRGRRVEI
jgi:mRNA-degrading endonuclease RelE of RelBE toxin-antitoxin system